MRAWSSLWRNVINAYERVLTISHAVRMTYVYCLDRNLRNANREKGGKGSKGMFENKFLANFVKGAFIRVLNVTEIFVRARGAIIV